MRNDDLWPLVAACADVSIPVTISDLGADDCPLIFVNTQFEELSERPLDDLAGKKLSCLFSDESDAGVAADFVAALRQGVSTSATLIFSLPDKRQARVKSYIEAIQVRPDWAVVLGCHYDLPEKAIPAGNADRPGDRSWLGVRRSLTATLAMQEDALRMRSDGMFKIAKLMLTRRRLGL